MRILQKFSAKPNSWTHVMLSLEDENSLLQKYSSGCHSKEHPLQLPCVICLRRETSQSSKKGPYIYFPNKILNFFQRINPYRLILESRFQATKILGSGLQPDATTKCQLRDKASLPFPVSAELPSYLLFSPPLSMTRLIKHIPLCLATGLQHSGIYH